MLWADLKRSLRKLAINSGRRAAVHQDLEVVSHAFAWATEDILFVDRMWVDGAEKLG